MNKKNILPLNEHTILLLKHRLISPAESGVSYMIPYKDK